MAFEEDFVPLVVMKYGVRTVVGDESHTLWMKIDLKTDRKCCSSWMKVQPNQLASEYCERNCIKKIGAFFQEDIAYIGS